MASATQSVTTPAYSNIYIVDLVIPFAAEPHVIPGVEVIEFVHQPHWRFDVVIGRDIICKGSLHLSPGRHFTFCL